MSGHARPYSTRHERSRYAVLNAADPGESLRAIRATICTVKRNEEVEVSRGLPLLGLFMAMASGLVMIAGFLVELPAALLVAAVLGFAAGCVLLAVAVARDTRRSGQPWHQAARHGIGSGLRWFFRLLP
jgi:hypothetical protein